MELINFGTLSTLINQKKKEGITFSDSEVKVEDGNIISGVFTVDMKTLRCDDLTPDQGKANLEGHLKSDDFFGVKDHTKAMFNITNVIKKGNIYAVSGKMTIGASKPLAP